MKAMILAAGLGTRLHLLTEKRPKALMPVVNIPIICRIIEHLKGHGISRIVVNAHHHYRQLIDYLDGGRPFGLEIDVRVEPELLGTGGGIKNTSDFWDNDPFFIINGDILTDIVTALSSYFTGQFTSEQKENGRYIMGGKAPQYILFRAEFPQV